MKVFLFIYSFRFLFYLFLAVAVAVVMAAAGLQSVAASGFGVSPSSLEFVVEKGSEASRHLTIYNSGDEAADFVAASSNPLLVRVLPDKGTIEGGEAAVVMITAAGKDVGTSEEEISISVGSRNGNGREVRLSLGTAVVVRITVIEAASAQASALVGMAISTGIVAAGLSACYASRRKIRRTLFAGA